MSLGHYLIPSGRGNTSHYQAEVGHMAQTPSQRKTVSSVAQGLGYSILEHNNNRSIFEEENCKHNKIGIINKSLGDFLVHL